eukprot:scaffold256739_cov31-Tisochrysis_lutea.AAC.4
MASREEGRSYTAARSRTAYSYLPGWERGRSVPSSSVLCVDALTLGGGGGVGEGERGRTELVRRVAGRKKSERSGVSKCSIGLERGKRSFRLGV